MPPTTWSATPVSDCKTIDVWRNGAYTRYYNDHAYTKDGYHGIKFVQPLPTAHTPEVPNANAAPTKRQKLSPAASRVRTVDLETSRADQKKIKIDGTVMDQPLMFPTPAVTMPVYYFLDQLKMFEIAFDRQYQSGNNHLKFKSELYIGGFKSRMPDQMTKAPQFCVTVTLQPEDILITRWLVDYVEHSVEISRFFFNGEPVTAKQKAAVKECIKAADPGSNHTLLGWLHSVTNFLSICGLYSGDLPELTNKYDRAPAAPPVIQPLIPNGVLPARTVSLDNQWTNYRNDSTGMRVDDAELRRVAAEMRIAKKIERKAMYHNLPVDDTYLSKIAAHGYYGPMWSDSNESCNTLVPFLRDICI